ncbi:MAG: trypsin-like peptidase domain-containing protein [Clostridia bacterium]|nr:trypsin-like peptidase domain-containing protein [Clostridia bacterium]
MKKILIGTMLTFSLFVVGCTETEVNMSPRVITGGEDAIQMLDEVRSAVVGISVDYDDGYAVGSGVAVVDGSLILTNNHVVEDGSNITLYFADETTAGADLLWADAGLDIAVLRSHRTIPYLAFGSSDDAKIGEDIYAIGTPLTLQFKHTVTKGIVSAKDRVVGVESDYGDSFMQSLLQHDASINPGNSGGPLINAQGEIIGINTLKASQGEGIGFAIPIEIGEKIATQLSANENYVAPYLGVFGFDSEIAKVYGYDLQEKGLFVVSVTGVLENTLQKGDVITKFGDAKIEKLLDLRLALFDHKVGDDVQLEFLRNGVLQKISITLNGDKEERGSSQS